MWLASAISTMIVSLEQQMKMEMNIKKYFWINYCIFYTSANMPEKMSICHGDIVILIIEYMMLPPVQF